MSNEITNTENTIVAYQNSDAFNMVARSAAMLAKSTIVPSIYQGKPENCFIAINMANRVGMDPLVVMQNMYVVNGKPSWSGQACTMLIKNNGEFKNVRHVYTGERGKDSWGCYVQAERADGEIVKGAEVTVDTAKKEGWYSRAGSKWVTMPELMLAYRASAWFARVFCPEALAGMHTVEEVEDAGGGKRAVKDVLNDE